MRSVHRTPKKQQNTVNLSSLFSAKLNGIAFSMRTRSPTDRFCKFFTSRSLLLSAQKHTPYKLFTYSTNNRLTLHIIYPLVCFRDTDTQIQTRSPHPPSRRSQCCYQHGSRRCWAGRSGRRSEWRVGSVCVCTSAWCGYNIERGSPLDCVLG